MTDNLDHHAAHDAATEIAGLDGPCLRKQINLARCYLDLRAQLARAEAERDEAREVASVLAGVCRDDAATLRRLSPVAFEDPPPLPWEGPTDAD